MMDTKYDYVVEIKVKGKDESIRHHLLSNLSFDVDGRQYEFYGAPLVEQNQTTTRIVLVKK